jgi:transketolase
MLIYALLHLTGYDLSIDDLKKFRQLHSKTAGHPEVGITPGVETTTGPLGQGLTNAVGMALAEKQLAAEFNQPDQAIVDHFTYVFMGDGCLMEGISHEACSLAGTLRLSKLVAFYDDNGISIDGHVEGWFTDDTPKRFEAYGWNVIPDVNGHDPEALDAAVQAAKAQGRLADGKPTLICCKTVIGMGSPNKAGTHDVHGAALGAAEVAATREALGWDHAPFEIPADIAAAWNAVERGQAAERSWRTGFDAYRVRYPALAAEFERRMAGDLLPAFAHKLPEVLAAIAGKADAVATRKASQNALDALAPLVPEFFGGSADLTGSNLTNFKGCVKAGSRPVGQPHELRRARVRHGRHHEWHRPARWLHPLRRHVFDLQRLQPQRHPHGRADEAARHPRVHPRQHWPGRRRPHAPERGAHPSLRIIPNLDVWRPADGLETAVAWAHAIEREDGPSALCLSRQNLPRLTGDASTALAMEQNIRRGGYVLSDMEGAQAVIVSTGSELELAMQAQAALAVEGIATRVVSMPCTNVFDRQSDAYQESVLPLALPSGRHRGSAPGLLAQIRGPHRGGGGYCQLWRVGPGQGPVRAFRYHVPAGGCRAHIGAPCCPSQCCALAGADCGCRQLTR